jgi:hypothetical protein
MLRPRNILFTTYVEYVHGGKFFLKCSTRVTENWRQCSQHSLECLNIKLLKRNLNSKNKEKIYSTDLKGQRLDKPCVQYLLYGGHLPGWYNDVLPSCFSLTGRELITQPLSDIFLLCNSQLTNNWKWPSLNFILFHLREWSCFFYIFYFWYHICNSISKRQ